MGAVGRIRNARSSVHHQRSTDMPNVCSVLNCGCNTAPFRVYEDDVADAEHGYPSANRGPGTRAPSKLKFAPLRNRGPWICDKHYWQFRQSAAGDAYDEGPVPPPAAHPYFSQKSELLADDCRFARARRRARASTPLPPREAVWPAAGP